jgi:hypothetical protein
MDKKDALLLHYVSEFHQVIYKMFRADFSELINLPYHNLTSDELTDRIKNLYAKGLIRLHSSDDRGG